MAPAAQTIRTAELRRGAETDRAAEPSRTPSEPQPAASGDENKVRELRGQSHDCAEASLDVRGQTALLREAFAPDQPGAAVDMPVATARSRVWLWRAFKVSVGLALMITMAGIPVLRFLELSSTEAVVNARLITIRAPIDGQVAFATDPRIGGAADQASPLLRIANPRADRGRLDEMHATYKQLRKEQPAAAAKLARLRALRADVVAQARSFQEGRVRELEARVRETESAIAAAAATREEAAAAAERASVLTRSGTIAKAVLDKVRRDALVAAETENSLQHRLAGIKIELDAARRGEYIGDNYNDRPSSAQQSDELSVRIAELEADLQAREVQIARVEAELELEDARFDRLSHAQLASPIAGTLWEVLVSNGEEVRRGQDLVRVLDCSGAVVTASVSERVYNRLRVGDGATFRLSGDNVDHSGRVVRVSGLAAPPDNLAISPASLQNGTYRVTVEVPHIAADSSCLVGRSGKLTFEPTSAPVASRSLALNWR